MKVLYGGLFAVLMLFAAGCYAQAAPGQDYLVTFHDQHPTGAFQEPLCVSVVRDGSVLGFAASGVVTLYFGPSSQLSGQWFVTRGREAVFTVPLGQGSATYITFSGNVGSNGSGVLPISDTSFVLVENGAVAAGGSFSAATSTCSSNFKPH